MRLSALLALLLVSSSVRAAEPSAAACPLLKEPLPLDIVCDPHFRLPAISEIRTEGEVELELTFGSGRMPERVVVLRSQPAGAFDGLATRSVTHGCYAHYLVDGRPHCYRLRQTVKVRLSKDGA